MFTVIVCTYRIRAGLDPTALDGGTARNSMYAKPFNGSAGQGGGAKGKDGQDDGTVANEALPSQGLAQYSLLGHDKKYENVDIELDVQAAP